VLNCQSAITLYAYRVQYTSGEIKLNDHEEIKWVSPEDLLKYDFPDPDLLIAKEVMNAFKLQKVSSRFDR
jgi:8-oxo-dGTP pyrophosphatase MutT (NUDIX family)